MKDSFSAPDFNENLSADVPKDIPADDPAQLLPDMPASEAFFDEPAGMDPSAAGDESVPLPEEELPSIELPRGIYEETDEVCDPYDEPYDDINEEPSEISAEPAYDIHVEPTVVRRPPQETPGTGRKVLRVFGVIGKYLLAIVLVLAILAAGLIGYLTVTEYNPAHAEIAQPGAVSVSKPLSVQSYRIVTFNTGFAGLDENADFFMDGGSGVMAESEEKLGENMLGIENILKSCDADFILLQEVDTDSKRSYEQNQWLQYEYDLADYESRFALNYSCNYVPYPLPETIGKVHSGIATYSRYDISSATRYSLPCPFSWPVRVANLKRCMLVTRIPMDGMEQELVLVNVHLEAYDDGEGRLAQMQQLTQFIEEEYAKGNFVIVGGDFNQNFPGAESAFPIKDPDGWTPGVLEEPSANWQYGYDSIVPSCRLLNQPFNPSSNLTQFYIIDGFLVSPNVKIDRVETLDEGFVYSDHNPVVMDFTLSFDTQNTEETAATE